MNALIASGAVNDGQLCYLKEDEKLYVLKDGKWSEVGGIPVVEGTLNEESSTEGIESYDIPEAQTSPFIFHSDIGYIFVDVIGEAYGSIVVADSHTWALIGGSDTTVTFSLYVPASLYKIDFSGNFPTDETSSIDVPFPFLEQIANSMCLVSDIDVSRVFLKNGNSTFGSFQTPIIYDTDGKYRCWTLTNKEKDNPNNNLATIKCKVVNLDSGGSTGGVSVTFED